ncbi:hypothetical protein [Streptomyces mirabilis]|uniref:hypothetical protein n=1 Tax=Streptomyces mirabilis TaxID=68239 RepID=UPI003412BB7B
MALDTRRPLDGPVFVCQQRPKPSWIDDHPGSIATSAKVLYQSAKKNSESRLQPTQAI